MIADQNMKNYDIAIIGGGLAGLSLACLLGKEDALSIAVIEAADPKKPMIADERTTAISYGSRLILERAGVWEELSGTGCEIRDIQILDSDSPVLLNFLSDEVEGKEFGTIIENSKIRDALNKQVKASRNITQIAPDALAHFEQSHDQITAQLKSGSTITAKLLIGADGRQSFIRDFLDIPARRIDYRQTAIVCIVAHENPHHHAAIEHFWPDGPFAILPMPQDKNGRHRSSVVFTEHRRRGVESLSDLSDKIFNRALQARFPESYGAVEMIGTRTSYPLSLVHAARYIDARVVLVADAAHGIHPIAGQGLNLGFRDVDELARLVLEAHSKGEDIGAATLLQTYQRRRRPDNMAMVAVTDGLVRLFSNNLPPVRLARKIGLKAVAKLPIAKRFFMKQAMADRG